MNRGDGSILGFTRLITLVHVYLLVTKVVAFSNDVGSDPSRIKLGSNKIFYPNGSLLQPTTTIPNVSRKTFTSVSHSNAFCQSRTGLKLRSLEEGDDIDGSNNSNLDKFRSLMGSLYGVAGLAHAGDCYFGESKLLIAAGSPTYSDLPLEGQALVALWCAAGPLAFLASHTGNSRIADCGLLFYGGVEVFGAAIIKTTVTTSSLTAPDIDSLTNTISVQVIVFASWLYSRNNDVSDKL